MVYRNHSMYKLEPKPLAIGGQAEVFIAEHRDTRQKVALKRILTDFDVPRMKHEIDVQMKLNHHNIMPILDYDSGYTWYTMPIANKVLPSEVEQSTLSDDDIMFIIQCCAQGIKEAHKYNIIHRDITPNNILQLQDDSNWVIADWGLVRQVGKTTIVRTAPGAHIGTEGFSAPEMWRDAHNAGVRSDIYSLGRVMEWMKTRIWPIPNIPTEGIVGELRLFIDKCIAHRESDRFQDIDEFLYSLNNLSKLYIPKKKIRFTKYLKKIIDLAYNNGFIYKLSRQDLLDTLGQGAYANHSKLSLSPWDLWIEDQDDNMLYLSDRGIFFAKGEISIPQEIHLDVHNNYIAAPNTRWVYIYDF